MREMSGRWRRRCVLYCFELIEIVKNDSADPAFKHLLARIYNARVKLNALCESFQVDPKTIRRWGRGSKGAQTEA